MQIITKVIKRIISHNNMIMIINNYNKKLAYKMTVVK